MVDRLARWLPILICTSYGLAILYPGQASACVTSQSPNRVIYVGDSHSTHEFGRELERALKASTVLHSQEVKRYAVAGSGSSEWAAADNTQLRDLTIRSYCDGDGDLQSLPPRQDFPSLRQLVGGIEPRALIIELGTNDIGLNHACKKTAEFQTKGVKALLDQIPSGTSCVWIGPTTMVEGAVVRSCGSDKMNVFIDLLQLTVRRRCRYIDSRKITAPTYLGIAPTSLNNCHLASNKAILPNNGDGVHFGGSLARFWADCAVLEMEGSQN